MLNPNDDDLQTLSTLAQTLRAQGWRMACAESCTGGLIAALCTHVAGSSEWFERGFVTYSNDAKHQLLGVPEAALRNHGAVSQAVVQAMAQGAAQRAGVMASVAVTGVAGPSGGSPDKPVGTVWLGWSVAGQTTTQRVLLPGDRAAVRQATARLALQGLVERLKPSTR